MQQQTSTLNALKPVLDDLARPPEELERDFEGFYSIRKSPGNVLYIRRNNNIAAFADHGNHIHFLASDPAEQHQSILAAIEIAQERGWRELEVTGTDDFRRRVWLEASLAGIRCRGYTPSPEDKAELEKMRPGSTPAPTEPAPDAKIAVTEPDAQMRAEHELFAKLGSAKDRLDASKDRPKKNRGNELAAETSHHNRPGR
ncbi:MAG: LPD7 domain-containing protein [Burkholderiales bacterium]